MNSDVTELVTTNEGIDLRSWNRPRSTEELVSFVTGRHARLAEVELWS